MVEEHGRAAESAASLHTDQRARVAIPRRRISSLSVDELLRRIALPLAVVDPRTGKLAAANVHFAQLLKIEPDDAPNIDLLSLSSGDYRRVLDALLTALSSGHVDVSEGRGLIRLPDGHVHEVHIWMRAIDPGRQDGRALLALVPNDRAARSDVSELADDSESVSLGSLDHDRHFNEIIPVAAEILDWAPKDHRGTSIPAASYSNGHSPAIAPPAEPADIPAAFHPNGHSPAIAPPAESAEERASRLEGHLWRIAMELNAAGLDRTPAVASTWWSHPATQKLSRRQLEVLRLLARWEPVRQIAQELFISESTVRNHLSAIYHAFGVFSREELLIALQGEHSPNG